MDDPSCYENGRVQYARLAELPLFREGIERLRIGSRDRRIAIVCAERDPIDCHRSILIAKILHQEGLQIEHICADGEIEPHSHFLTRILNLSGLPHQDLFRDESEFLAEAFAKQEERIAFRVSGSQAGTRRSE